MLDISSTSEKIVIKDSFKKEITFNKNNNNMFIDDYEVSFPGEYEKSGILLEVKEYNSILFYNFLIDSKRVIFIINDSFELKEEILSFFGDVDLLIIIGTKNAIKIFENVEAKIVIPYGEGKDIFLNNLGQHIEEVESYSVKAELPIDSTLFVNLR